MGSHTLLLGLKHTVAAIDKATGEIRWESELPGGLTGSGLVSVIADDTKVYAYTAGHLHCLDLGTGDLLWTNELKGYGYGLAVLSLPGIGASPDAATLQQLLDEQSRSSSTNTSGTGASITS